MDISWTSVNAGRRTSGKLSDKEDVMGHSEAKEKKQTNKKIKYRRYRMAFTTDQINNLESAFKRGPYVNSSQRQEIAEALGLSDRCVKVWFQNRRMREKQLTKEQEDDEEMKQGKTKVCCPESDTKQISSVKGIPMPSHTSMPNASSVPNINPVKEEINITNHPFRPNYYQDISPARDQPTTPSKYTRTSPTVSTYFNTMSSDYKASAEFSIDLCKKYKSMIKGSQQDRSIGSDCLSREQATTHGIKRKMESPKLQDAPEDLSMKRVNSTKTQVPSPKNNTPDSAGMLPIYVNFPQPFTDRNVMWNQLTIPSVIPNVVPAASISILPTEAAPVPTAYYVQKESCNCCKCPKNPAHQNPTSNQNYIINVVPYQNYHKY